MNSPISGEHSEPMNAASAQLIVQSQALMMQLLDLQKWQQQVALRFIDAHQQLLQGCAAGVALPAAAFEQFQPQPAALPQPVVHAPAPAVAVAQPAPAPVVQAAPAPVARAVAAAPAAVRAPVAVNRASNGATARVTVPAPAERKAAAAAPSRNGNSNGATVAPAVENGHHANGNGSGAPVLKAAPAPAPATPAAPSGGANAPAVEQFRAALLKAVSERTGYPEDMLDETLPLESGLGIDSIKTVEIFSNLKEYHHVFTRDGQDEEEALKEFTQLKNLGDIISAYELHYQAQSSGEAAVNGKDTNGHVERYTLEAKDAGSLNGEKKNSRSVT